MKILILGGAGFLGANLVRRCLRDKNQIIVLDSLDERLKSTEASLSEVRGEIDFIRGDIRDADLMGKVVMNQDVIVHCAGQTSHPLSLKDPYFDLDVNVKGALTVLEAMRLFNSQAKIIYTSSSTVVGRSEGGVIDERHKEMPLEIYSANKGLAEKYFSIYHKVHGLRTLVLRFANLYGPFGKGCSEFGFINYFIYLATEDKNITLYGEGTQSRNVMYVADACELICECLKRDDLFGELYFATHHEHYTVKEIAKEIIRVFGAGRITSIPWPKMREKIEIDDVIISAAKLNYKLKFSPQYDLKRGLFDTKNILQENAYVPNGEQVYEEVR